MSDEITIKLTLVHAIIAVSLLAGGGGAAAAIRRWLQRAREADPEAIELEATGAGEDSVALVAGEDSVALVAGEDSVALALGTRDDANASN